MASQAINNNAGSPPVQPQQACSSWCNCSWSTIATAVAGLAAAAFAYVSYTAGSVQAGFAAVVSLAAPLSGYASTAVALATANPMVAGAVIVGALVLGHLAHTRGYLASCSSCCSTSASNAEQERGLDSNDQVYAEVTKTRLALEAANEALRAAEGADKGGQDYAKNLRAAQIVQAEALLANVAADKALEKLNPAKV